MHYAKCARAHFTFSPSRVRRACVTPTRACTKRGAGRRSYLLFERGASEGLPDFSLSIHARYTGNKGIVTRRLDERIAARTPPIKQIQRVRLTLTLEGGCICLNVRWCIKKISVLKRRRRWNYRNYPPHAQNFLSNL